MAVVIEGQDLNGNVAGEGIVLQLAEHGPAKHIRQMNVERDGCRIVIGRERKRLYAPLRDDPFESRVVCCIKQYARKVGIVFDDEKNPDRPQQYGRDRLRSAAATARHEEAEQG